MSDMFIGVLATKEERHREYQELEVMQHNKIINGKRDVLEIRSRRFKGERLTNIDSKHPNRQNSGLG